MEQVTPWSIKGWVIVDGLKVLVKQGIAQYEIFSQRPAPVHVMRRSVQDEAIKNGYSHMW
jgi:shikimate 5-dehydrogenase